MECPRCRHPISELGVGGPYRGASSYPRCGRCRLNVLVQNASTAKRVAGSVLASNETVTRESCPKCGGVLTRLTIRDGSDWSDIDECGRCGTILLDDAELERVRAILVSTRGGENVTLALPVGTDAQRLDAEQAVADAERKFRARDAAFAVLSVLFDGD